MLKPPKLSDRRACLIISLTARALAASAKKADIDAYSIDLFQDLDTIRYSRKTMAVELGTIGFESRSLFDAIEKLDSKQELPVIYGGGLEHDPNLIRRISKNRRLVCNPADVIEQIFLPKLFFACLSKLSIPHPATRFDAPDGDGIWLKKFPGSCGGIHVDYMPPHRIEDSSGFYFQKYCPGRIVTATVYAHNGGAEIVGFSEQWCDESSVMPPFAYGGAVSIAAEELPDHVSCSMKRAAQEIVSSFGLRGLASLDMIVNDNGWVLLEVNPRPSATFELHEGEESFLDAHWKAFDGEEVSLRSMTLDSVFNAHAVIYASSPMRVPAGWSWPSDVRDLPASEEIFQIGEPVCTVYTEAKCSALAKDQVLKRHQQLCTMMEHWRV